MDEFKIFNELDKCKKYDIALITTFNFDINFFEHFILNKLIDSATKKITLFVDLKELSKAVRGIENSAIGKKYFVSPISVAGAFHPKVCLFLGKDCAKLIVSSANLTSSGYLTNNEIFNVFDYDNQDDKNFSIIKDAIDFFVTLNQLAELKDNYNFEEVNMWLKSQNQQPKQNEEIYFIHNIDEGIIEKISKIIVDPLSIDIAVPFYDNKLNALQEIIKTFPHSKVNLYIQNHKSKFPINLATTVDIEFLNVYNAFNDRKSTNFYHGKVIRFVTKENEFILYGSANCTESALLKTYKSGNVECDVIEKGSIGEFDYFFDNFKLCDEEPVCNLITYQNEFTSKIFYKYGICREHCELHFGYKTKIDDVKFFFDGTELQYAYEEDDIVIKIENPSELELSNIFNVDVQYIGDIYSIKCWIISEFELLTQRINSENDIIFRADFDNDEDKFYEDKYRIICGIASNADEYFRENEVINYYEENPDNENDDENEVSEEGIISYVIPEYSQYKVYKQIGKIRDSYITRFFHRITSNRLGFCDATNKDATTSSEFRAYPKRAATTQEKKFFSFVKRRIKSLLEDELVHHLPLSNYINIALIFFEVFDKYIFVDDIFDVRYILDSKETLLTKILSKIKQENLSFEEETKTVLLVSVLEVVLENYFYNAKNMTIDNLANKRTIQELDEMFGIRSSFSRYVELAINNIKQRYDTKEFMDLEFAISYVDGLFSYKLFDNVLSDIKKDFGKDASIDIKGKTIVISLETEDIVNYFKINKFHSLKEIVNYSKHSGDIDGISITVINNKIYSKAANPVRKIVFSINIKTGICKPIYVRELGDSSQEAVLRI